MSNLVKRQGGWFLSLRGSSGLTQLQGQLRTWTEASAVPAPMHSPPTGQTAGPGALWGREAVGRQVTGVSLQGPKCT